MINTSADKQTLISSVEKSQLVKLLTNKEKSTKKSRLKTKLLSIIPYFKEMENKQAPISLINVIKKARFEFMSLNRDQQESIISTIASLSKEDILVMLLLIPQTAEEMKFVKEIVINEQFIDNLFRNIDYDIII